MFESHSQLIVGWIGQHPKVSVFAVMGSRLKKKLFFLQIGPSSIDLNLILLLHECVTCI